jgi:GNAT superfamily N-acetyltransferase
VSAVATLLDEATLWVSERGYDQWPMPFPPDEIEAAIERGEVYVAELDDDVVATVTLLWEDELHWGERPPDAAYVHKLAVSRARAGQRIGQTIVEWAEATAAANGRAFLRLDCHRTNPGIRRYYEQLGFVHCADEVIAGRDLSLYERPVHARSH